MALEMVSSWVQMEDASDPEALKLKPDRTIGPQNSKLSLTSRPLSMISAMRTRKIVCIALRLGMHENTKICTCPTNLFEYKFI